MKWKNDDSRGELATANDRNTTEVMLDSSLEGDDQHETCDDGKRSSVAADEVPRNLDFNRDERDTSIFFKFHHSTYTLNAESSTSDDDVTRIHPTNLNPSPRRLSVIQNSMDLNQMSRPVSKICISKIPKKDQESLYFEKEPPNNQLMTELTQDMVKNALGPLRVISKNSQPPRKPLRVHIGGGKFVTSITVKVPESVVNDPKLKVQASRIVLKKDEYAAPKTSEPKMPKSSSKSLLGKSKNVDLNELKKRLSWESSDEDVRLPAKKAKVEVHPNKHVNSSQKAVKGESKTKLNEGKLALKQSRQSLKSVTKNEESRIKKSTSSQTILIESSRSNSPIILDSGESNDSTDAPLKNASGSLKKSKDPSLLKKTLELNLGSQLAEERSKKDDDQPPPKKIPRIDPGFRIPRLNRPDEETSEPNKNENQHETNEETARKRPKPRRDQNNPSILETLLPQSSSAVQRSDPPNSEPKPQTKSSVELPPTLHELTTRRSNFNIAIGFKYAYFSPLFLLNDYVERLKKFAALDFTELTRRLPPAHISGAFDPSLDINQLDHDERLHLCRLMSRSAGLVNVWKLFGFDSWLREVPHGFRAPRQKQVPPPCNEENSLIWLSTFTLSQAFIFYNRVMGRLQAPYSRASLFPMGKTIYQTIRVTFQNDLVENKDTSIESCVRYALHNSCERNRHLTGFLHSQFALEVEAPSSSQKPSKPRPQICDITLENFDDARTIINDEQLLNTIYMRALMSKLFSRPITRKLDILRTNHTRITHGNQARVKRIDELNKKTQPRFANFTGSNFNSENRGKMRDLDLENRILSEAEFKRRLRTVEKDKNLTIKYSKLFKNTSK